MLRANARLSDVTDKDAAAAAMAVVETIFARMRSGYSGTISE
jgi:hypothetical protein